MLTTWEIGEEDEEGKGIPKWFLGMVGVAVGMVLVAGIYAYRGKLLSFFRRQGGKIVQQRQPDVAVPTIINGELVFPKVATTSGTTSSSIKNARLGVLSANLSGTYNNQVNPPKLAAIRILGETVNVGDRVVDGISPLVRFFDKEGKLVASKIGRLSPGFEFFDLPPTKTSVYDVAIDDPPDSERLEISLNVATASESAVFETLKIASRSMEVKLADYPSQSSGSGGKKVEYYTVVGTLVNQLPDPVTEIAVYAWVKNKENKVFGFSRVDFKNDLLPAGEKIDFKMIILPLQLDQKMEAYEVAAWGRRYKLSL